MYFHRVNFSKVYFYEVYPAYTSSKLCEFISFPIADSQMTMAADGYDGNTQVTAICQLRISAAWRGFDRNTELGAARFIRGGVRSGGQAGEVRRV